jgi:hypothetical protein
LRTVIRLWRRREQRHTNVLESSVWPTRQEPRPEQSTVVLRQRMPELALQMAALIAQGT